MKKSELREMIRKELLNESDYSENYEVRHDINGEYFIEYRDHGKLRSLYLGDKNAVKKVIKKLVDVIK